MATTSGTGPLQAATPEGTRSLLPPFEDERSRHPAGDDVDVPPAPSRSGQEALTPEQEFHELLASSFECIPVGAIIAGLDGSFLHVNPYFCRLLGRSPEELRSHRIGDFISPEQRESMRHLVVSILDGGVESYQDETVFVRPDGSRLALGVTGTVLKTASGRPRAVITLFREAPERPFATSIPDPLAYLERLAHAEAGADGAVLREEFDTFCRTVSQEFRVPLRIIEGYSEIVVDDFSSRLDTVSLRYMHTIRDQARRLSALIDNTLALARIISHPLVRDPIDLSAMALDTAAVVRAETHTHDVDVRIEQGLAVYADSALVGRLLKHLFENAFRFSRSSPSPVIEFGLSISSEPPAFFVRDNGAGFDMGSAYKLFLPFETLHEGSEAAGAGVGLAEVRRIVSRHGGRVWGEGSPGCGATFYFTLSPGEEESSEPSNV